MQLVCPKVIFIYETSPRWWSSSYSDEIIVFVKNFALSLGISILHKLYMTFSMRPRSKNVQRAAFLF